MALGIMCRVPARLTYTCVQLIMNVPFTAVHFSTYETVKRLIDRTGEDEGLLTQLVAGGTAGALSAASTNPLDVVKTRLQTDGMLHHRQGSHSTAVVHAPACCFLLNVLASLPPVLFDVASCLHVMHGIVEACKTLCEKAVACILKTILVDACEGMHAVGKPETNCEG
jgi:type III secretory pathway component EscS